MALENVFDPARQQAAQQWQQTVGSVAAPLPSAFGPMSVDASAYAPIRSGTPWDILSQAVQQTRYGQALAQAEQNKADYAAKQAQYERDLMQKRFELEQGIKTEEKQAAIESAQIKAEQQMQEVRNQAENAADMLVAQGRLDPSQRQAFINAYGGGNIATLIKPVKEQYPYGKPPKDFRYTDAGDLEVIPGSATDIKQKKIQSKDKQFAQTTIDDFQATRKIVKDLLANREGLKGVTGISGWFPSIPKTEIGGITVASGRSKDAEAKLEQLKSNLSLSKLQAMRQASPTGGALGNVSDAEGKRLEVAYAALQAATSIEQFEQELNNLDSLLAGSIQNVANTYAENYNESLNVNKNTETVNVGGQTYQRPANMTDAQWAAYKQAMGVR